MPEPLKNLYTPELVASLCHTVESMYPQFDSETFTKKVFDETWDSRELKERMLHISKTLHAFLPADYRAAVDILKPVSSRFEGFEYMFFPGYVELYGLDDYETSVSALEYFTPFSTSEVSVRPFIKKYPDEMMAQMQIWAGSENHHVRRLASEGCRPRLPWAMALPAFKKDPRPVLNILEKLKNDESEYVRRSVANNLNDISKDNPEIVIETAKSWLGDNPHTDWIVKHACRTLLKQGEPSVMKLFGFTPPGHIRVKAFVVDESVNMGENLAFSFTLETDGNYPGKLRIEYAVDFMKSNGKLSRKIFKVSESECPQQEKEIVKKHSFRAITTRKHYPGQHALAVLVNGHELAYTCFELLEES